MRAEPMKTASRTARLRCPVVLLLGALSLSCNPAGAPRRDALPVHETTALATDENVVVALRLLDNDDVQIGLWMLDAGETPAVVAKLRWQAATRTLSYTRFGLDHRAVQLQDALPSGTEALGPLHVAAQNAWRADHRCKWRDGDTRLYLGFRGRCKFEWNSWEEDPNRAAMDFEPPGDRDEVAFLLSMSSRRAEAEHRRNESFDDGRTPPAQVGPGAEEEDAGAGLPEAGDPIERHRAGDCCPEFPDFEDDHTCTQAPDMVPAASNPTPVGGFPLGWCATSLNQGCVSIQHCCSGPGSHDQCFYNCPTVNGQCAGTQCILSCNNALKNCCMAAGGHEAYCNGYFGGTSVGGGAGPNGCGKEKMKAFCMNLAALSSGAAGSGGSGIMDVPECKSAKNAKCACERCVANGFGFGMNCGDATKWKCKSNCIPALFDDKCENVPGGGTKVECKDFGGGCNRRQCLNCPAGQICEESFTGTPQCKAPTCPSPATCTLGNYGGCVVPDPTQIPTFRRKCVLGGDGCPTWGAEHCGANKRCDPATNTCVSL